MTDPIFITSPVNVLHGDAARTALQATNDAAYYEAGKGVLSVPLERWQRAQQYERETWLTYGLSATEDRNLEHAALFNDYAALPDLLGDTIELGCGAFTNLREILARGHQADSITLLDPLLNEYLVHPHCTYSNGTLTGCPVTQVAKPIEAYSTKKRYDTIIMINVLPHCQDANKVMRWISAHLRKGGHLVFGECVDERAPMDAWDVGHPIRFTEAQIAEWLAGYTEVYRNGSYAIVRK